MPIIGQINQPNDAVNAYCVNKLVTTGNLLIQQESMREGQWVLRYLALSVKDVGQSVGFDDAQYFSSVI